MNKHIDALSTLLDQYYDALETNHVKEAETIFVKYQDLKHFIKTLTLSKSDKKCFRMICSEFRVLSNRENRNKLFENVPKEPKESKVSTNSEYLKRSTQTARATSDKLRESLQELHESREIGRETLPVLYNDNERIRNAQTNLENIESDAHVAMKLITQTVKRLYTDKLIILFTFIVVCLIIIIILMRFRVI